MLEWKGAAGKLPGSSCGARVFSARPGSGIIVEANPFAPNLWELMCIFMIRVKNNNEFVCTVVMDRQMHDEERAKSKRVLREL